MYSGKEIVCVELFLELEEIPWASAETEPENGKIVKIHGDLDIYGSLGHLYTVRMTVGRMRPRLPFQQANS